MTLPLVYTGRFPGDGTGDPGKVAFDKINAWLTFLNAGGGGGGGGGGALSYLADTLNADTNDYSPGGSFPADIGLIDFLLNTADVNLTGMQAGVFNLQTVWVRNSPSSTFNLLLPIESSGSSGANRWNGSTGIYALTPGDKVAGLYSTTLARWVI